MPRFSSNPSSRTTTRDGASPYRVVTLRMNVEDDNYLRQQAALHPDLDYNSLVRQILHQYVQHARDRERQIIDQGTNK